MAFLCPETVLRDSREDECTADERKRSGNKDERKSDSFIRAFLRTVGSENDHNGCIPIDIAFIDGIGRWIGDGAGGERVGSLQAGRDRRHF